MWNDTVIESIRACAGTHVDLEDANLGCYVLDSPLNRRIAIDSLLGKIKYLAPVERQKAVDSVQLAANGAFASDLMMTSAQLVALHRAGMLIGAHTCTHPILASIPDQSASFEINRSKFELEAILGTPIELFAYPNGKPGKDYLNKHALMIQQAGFIAAVSTASGTSSAATDPYQLARFSPWDENGIRYGIRMLINLRHGEPQLAESVVESEVA